MRAAATKLGGCAADPWRGETDSWIKIERVPVIAPAARFMQQRGGQ